MVALIMKSFEYTEKLDFRGNRTRALSDFNHSTKALKANLIFEILNCKIDNYKIDNCKIDNCKIDNCKIDLGVLGPYSQTILRKLS